jgi:hypothetical protein
MHLNSEIETNVNEKWGYWKCWETHRNMLMKLVNENVIGIHNNDDHIAIFGAGECDDIDLRFLTNRFKEVYLIDRDIQAMEAGIINQQLSDLENNKITIIGGFDFAGISKQFYVELEEMLGKNQPLRAIVSFLRDKANILEMPSNLDGLKNKFSAVLSAAVHSQLCNGNYEIFSKYYERYNKIEMKEIEEALRYLYTQAVKTYNNLLLHVAKADASLLLALDMIEISEEAGTLEYLPVIAKAIADGDTTAITSLTLQYGVLGSVEGQADIINRIDFKNFDEYLDGKEIIRNFWVWNFDSQLAYMIDAYTIHLSAFIEMGRGKVVAPLSTRGKISGNMLY